MTYMVYQRCQDEISTPVAKHVNPEQSVPLSTLATSVRGRASPSLFCALLLLHVLPFLYIYYSL